MFEVNRAHAFRLCFRSALSFTELERFIFADVKELARERMGAPPAAKVVPHKKKYPVKHKATLEKLLNEEE